MKNHKSKLPAQKTQTLYSFKKSTVHRGAEASGDTTTSIFPTVSITSSHNG